MDIERAREINGRICHAWFVLGGLANGPVPSLVGVSLEEAGEAGRLVRQANDYASAAGGQIFAATVSEADLPRLFARAVLNSEQ